MTNPTTVHSCRSVVFIQPLYIEDPILRALQTLRKSKISFFGRVPKQVCLKLSQNSCGSCTIQATIGTVYTFSHHRRFFSDNRRDHLVFCLVVMNQHCYRSYPTIRLHQSQTANGAFHPTTIVPS